MSQVVGSGTALTASGASAVRIFRLFAKISEVCSVCSLRMLFDELKFNDSNLDVCDIAGGTMSAMTSAPKVAGFGGSRVERSETSGVGDVVRVVIG